MASNNFLGRAAFLSLKIEYVFVVLILTAELEVALQVGPGVLERLLVLAGGVLAARWLRSFRHRQRVRLGLRSS